LVPSDTSVTDSYGDSSIPVPLAAASILPPEVVRVNEFVPPEFLTTNCTPALNVLALGIVAVAPEVLAEIKYTDA
jgi:hypothetical protein